MLCDLDIQKDLTASFRYYDRDGSVLAVADGFALYFLRRWLDFRVSRNQFRGGQLSMHEIYGILEDGMLQRRLDGFNDVF